MSVKIMSKRGKVVTLLNPAEKAAKFADELNTRQKFTNSGAVKHDAKGRFIMLNAVERSYRAGYLDARKDNSNAYKAKKKKHR